MALYHSEKIGGGIGIEEIYNSSFVLAPANTNTTLVKSFTLSNINAHDFLIVCIGLSNHSGNGLYSFLIKPSQTSGGFGGFDFTYPTGSNVTPDIWLNVQFMYKSSNEVTLSITAKTAYEISLYKIYAIDF